MTAPLRSLAHGRLAPLATLVLVDLCESTLAPLGSGVEITRVLANCQEALAHARALGSPIAFVRPAKADARRGEGAWIAGFRPRRSEMVFFRRSHSCYSSPAFADMMAHAGSHMVLAGLSTETVFLATAVEAHHQQHGLTYLLDASLGQRLKGERSNAAKDVVSHFMGIYGEVTRTQAWIEATALADGER